MFSAHKFFGLISGQNVLAQHSCFLVASFSDLLLMVVKTNIYFFDGKGRRSAHFI